MGEVLFPEGLLPRTDAFKGSKRTEADLRKVLRQLRESLPHEKICSFEQDNERSGKQEYC